MKKIDLSLEESENELIKLQKTNERLSKQLAECRKIADSVGPKKIAVDIGSTVASKLIYDGIKVAGNKTIEAYKENKENKSLNNKKKLNFG